MTPLQASPVTAEFFAGTARGELLVRRCADCGRHLAPRCVSCEVCGGTDLAWTAASGAGRVVSWTVLPDRAGGPPVVAGIVELAEGPWLNVRFVDVVPEAMTGGLAVEVRFVRPEGGEAVPVFAPAEQTLG
ncbi:Zn-ribbon domain-containing OB-fold protein [Yinghuangia seranimata]|uniref:Zn-ribbon domain-containing OB-fold protein n=1 Tax=Yinghuangia seranimata TaxID=408067 RepID=UPI00248CA246|nr:OB-fold domain-containing protein [Yinghuangia seranimata]MDI2129889.1 OB-fold domain-containing protein [Yinghuangia seranimata]